MPIRVILGDDHELVRQGLKALLEREGFQVAGEAANGQEVIRMIPDIRPDVAILDVSMPLLNGIRLIFRRRSSPPILFRRGSARFFSLSEKENPQRKSLPSLALA